MILWAHQAAYLREDADFRIIIAGTNQNYLKVIADIESHSDVLEPRGIPLGNFDSFRQ